MDDPTYSAYCRARQREALLKVAEILRGAGKDIIPDIQCLKRLAEKSSDLENGQPINGVTLTYSFEKMLDSLGLTLPGGGA